ncbi:ABC-2 type transporter-domain-containing protein [Mycena alexandri]|uniref:ABC-2 type transporter-domain-containing protein n=1 Tax=Mycena alexandri TaxID=1745969 RepID=A0AAD6S4R5_9AGAR|nr:ABC-2 type transporter-domain-containing protein [Mycena alexandri]
MQQMSTFVEQEDALLGVLTVRESVAYALRLQEVAARVNRVLTALGLQSCADQRIGTPISRGISGGQKRRVTAACAMVTFPYVFLDSTSAREVMSAIRTLAVSEGMIVIATIHQPALETLAQFTDMLLLAEGRTCFSGKVGALEGFLERGASRWTSTPSDHAMNFLNNDFTASATGHGARRTRLSRILPLYQPRALTARARGHQQGSLSRASRDPRGDGVRTHGLARDALLEHDAVNYSRNLLAYGVRAGITIWIRLGTDDSTINDRLSVHFFSVAFLAFMSVAGIPGFLEERSVYYRETNNGLYTTLPFILANTLVNMPFLFVCTLLFTLISYWAMYGLHPGADAFFRFLGFLYLAILAAESQMVVIAALIPISSLRLLLVLFSLRTSVNGFWMSVGGYFIKARSLPRFWFYSFHYMDYQRYAFELLTNSDLRGLAFKCVTVVNGTCTCAYPSSTPETCTVSGADILNYLDVGNISYGKWAAILLATTLIYRIALYFALKLHSK